MVALFLDDNKTNDHGDGRRMAKKVIGFYWQNIKFARASRYFVQFCAVVAPLRHETSYFHTLASWSRWTQHKSCLFLLIILDTVLSDSTRGNFTNICQIKDRWSLKRCEKSTFTLVPGSILMNQYPFYNFLSYFVIFFFTFLLIILSPLLYITLRGTILVYLDVPLSSPSNIQCNSI